MSRRTYADSPTDPTSTLANAIGIGDPTVELTADPGSEMPTTGPFSFVVGESPDTKAFNAASRSGTTITLIGTAATAHDAGQPVNTAPVRIDVDKWAQLGENEIGDDDLATGIDAAKIADGSVSNTEFEHLGGVTAPIQTGIDGKVAKSGDTMTGPLALPLGSATAPALNFGTANTGLYQYATLVGTSILGAQKFIVTPVGVTVFGSIAYSGALLFSRRELTASTYNFSTSGDSLVQVAGRSAGTTINLPQILPTASSHVMVFVDPHGYFGTGGNITLVPYDDGFGGFTAYDTINGVQGAGLGGANYVMNATGGVYLLVSDAVVIDPLSYAGFGAITKNWTCKQIA
ncbi:MAG: hypothetical protein ACPHCI_06130 [Solirubrobacterales bacterium]